MKLHDESIEQVIALAEDAIMEGDCHNGKRMLENVLYDEPGYAKVHASLGWMYQYYKNDDRMAVRCYSTAIHFNRSYMYAYEGLMLILFKRKHYRLIEFFMNRALNEDKIGKRFAYETLGRGAEYQGHFVNAIKQYRKALVYCMDNDEMQELKETIKRTKLKRFKNRIKKWQLQD